MTPSYVDIPAELLVGIDDDAEQGRRCAMIFPLGDGLQEVRGVYVGSFVDELEGGGTGKRTHRMLGDDGQCWENIRVRFLRIPAVPERSDP